MAKDIKLQIGANIQRAEAAMRDLQRTGRDVTSILQRDFEQLGIKSDASFDGQRKAATQAYEKIKASGVATASELDRAQKAHADRMISIDEAQFGKRTSLLQTYKQNWIAVTAVIAGAMATAYKAFTATEEAAKAQAQENAFKRLADSHGASSEQIISDLKRVSGGAVSTRILIEKAGTAMLTGIKAAELPKLMEVARASSKITGQTVTKSFEDISMAVARGSRMILDNLGIIVKVEEANETYAATLGKTASELTEAEKKQAFLNATVAAGQEIIDRVGESNEDTIDSYARLRVGIEETGLAIAGLAVSKTLVDSLAESFNRLRRAIASTATEDLADLRSELQHTTEQLAAAETAPFGMKWAYGIDGLREKAERLRAEIAAIEKQIAPTATPAATTAAATPTGPTAAEIDAADKAAEKAFRERVRRLNEEGKLARNDESDVAAASDEDAIMARLRGAKADPSASDKIGQSLAALRQALRSETEVIEDAYDARVKIIEDAAEQGLITADEANDLEIKAAEDREAKLTELKKRGDEDRKQSTLSMMDTIGGASAQLFGTMASLQDQDSKKGFERYKEFAKAQAGISTALAVMNAIANTPNLYAGIAASIVAGAMGAVQIAKIDSMQYQGARAGGGPIIRGNRMLVGERGPEVVEFNANGNVIPGDQLGGGGSRQINSVTNVFQISPGVSQAVQAELMRVLPYVQKVATNAVQDGLRRSRRR